MPEGHSIHRLARRHRRLLVGRRVRASSPQGRFAEGAALIDGARVVGTEAWGKHLFHFYADHVDGDPLVLHIHLGLFGRFREGGGEPDAPRDPGEQPPAPGGVLPDQQTPQAAGDDFLDQATGRDAPQFDPRGRPVPPGQRPPLVVPAPRPT